MTLDRRAEGHPEEELIAALEPDQIVAAASRPLPRYRIGRATGLMLWVLRVYVLLIAGLVVYTFVVSL